MGGSEHWVGGEKGRRGAPPVSQKTRNGLGLSGKPKKWCEGERRERGVLQTNQRVEKQKGGTGGSFGRKTCSPTGRQDKTRASKREIAKRGMGTFGGAKEGDTRK